MRIGKTKGPHIPPLVSVCPPYYNASLGHSLKSTFMKLSILYWYCHAYPNINVTAEFLNWCFAYWGKKIRGIKLRIFEKDKYVCQIKGKNK